MQMIISLADDNYLMISLLVERLIGAPYNSMSRCVIIMMYLLYYYFIIIIITRFTSQLLLNIIISIAYYIILYIL